MATDTVQEIKSRLSIADIISPYVKLRRAGRSMVGLCPFHKEKTGSFHVSVERGTWHCFGCGLGGDGFSFIEKVEGVDFKGALQLLADKAGVTIIYDSKRTEEISKKERLFALMARASEWYAGQMDGSASAAYAKKRGLTDETVTAWRLGHAPDAWRALLEALIAEGFKTEELMSAGLVKEADGKPGTYYDRFRNRLMFPIRDSQGRTVAFTGRTLGDDLAKYLNSPETDLYHKSEVLFAMDKAKDAIRTRKFTLLVEGQMDSLLAHQAGFTNAVALSGTALTEKHLALAKRYSENLMLVLDADPAGLKATARSAALALYSGLRVKAARLPKGKDPADLIVEDSAEFGKRVAAAKPVVDFFLAELAEGQSDSHRLLRSVEDIVLPLIAAVQSPIEQDHFIQNVARTLGVSPESIKESVKRLPKYGFATDVNTNERKAPPPPRRSTVENREEQVLAVMHAYAGTPLANRVKSRYLQITGAHELPASSLPESALFFAEQTFGEEPNEEAADELLNAFEQAVIREAYQAAVIDLRKAEAGGDPAAITEAEAACAKLSSRLSAFGN